MYIDCREQKPQLELEGALRDVKVCSAVENVEISDNDNDLFIYTSTKEFQINNLERESYVNFCKASPVMDIFVGWLGVEEWPDGGNFDW